MIRECARAFLNERGVSQYQFSGEHQYYEHVLKEIYRPLVERGLIEEYENNNYKIPEGSKLENICRTQLSDGRGYMKWDEIDWGSFTTSTT